jgi:hypothetical protein
LVLFFFYLPRALFYYITHLNHSSKCYSSYARFSPRPTPIIVFFFRVSKLACLLEKKEIPAQFGFLILHPEATKKLVSVVTKTYRQLHVLGRRGAMVRATEQHTTSDAHVC